MDRMMLAPSVLLIVGTDTGVGKTWTGCALARILCRGGRRVVAVKPVETGCPGAPAETEDGVALARATGQAEPLHALLRFRESVAPSEAADREGTQIDFDDLVRRVREHAACADLALVEGAGGLLSPLTWEHNAVELARAPRPQPVGNSGCGRYRARATGRLDWRECCYHLPTLWLFPYGRRTARHRVRCYDATVHLVRLDASIAR